MLFATERMREHYSTVALDEKRMAMASVIKLVRRAGAESGADRRPKKATPGRAEPATGRSS